MKLRDVAEWLGVVSHAMLQLEQPLGRPDWLDTSDLLSGLSAWSGDHAWPVPPADDAAEAGSQDTAMSGSVIDARDRFGGRG